MNSVLMRRLPWLALLLSFVLSIVLIWFGADGVRGTDQYNYLADTETIISGSAPITNLQFPAKILREEDWPTPAWFHHNGPSIYIAATIGKIVGAYKGWIVMNIVSHLVTALCIWLILRSHANVRTANWICSAYLLSPTAIWLGINVLQEMFFSAVVASTIAGIIYRRRALGLLVAVLSIFVGVVSHPIFLPVSLLFSVFLFIELLLGSHDRVAKFFCSIVLAVGTYYLIVVKSSYFPSSFQPNLLAIITSSVPGESNMYWHYSTDQRVINTELLLGKLNAAVNRHFFRPMEIPFFAFTNVAILCCLYLLVKHVRKAWLVVLVPSLFLGIYISMIVLQQNQPRYQQIVAAAVFVLIGIAWYRSKVTVPAYALIFVLFCNAIVGSYLARVASRDANFEAIELASFVKKLEALGVEETARVAAFDLSPHSPLAISLKPRELLSVRTDMMNDQDISTALKRFKPSYVLVKTTDVSLELRAQYISLNMVDKGKIEDTFFGDVSVIEVSY